MPDTGTMVTDLPEATTLADSDLLYVVASDTSQKITKGNFKNAVKSDELIDIRTGADGTLYESAGNAVRNQYILQNNAIRPYNKIFDLESGSFQTNRKDKGPNDARIRNVTPFPTSNLYYMALPSGYSMYVFMFDKDMTLLGNLNVTQFYKSSLNSNTRYINIQISKTGHESDDISGEVTSVENNMSIIWQTDADNTLALSGLPADSKAVGDFLNASVATTIDCPNNTDFNTLKTAHIYRLSYASTYSNNPISGKSGYLMVLKSPGHPQNILQIVFLPTTGNIYQRIYASNAWTAWKNVLNDQAMPLKLHFGANENRKASDHGGFWNRPSEEYLEDSPLAFQRSSDAGIKYHNVDIICSSDGVPIVSHNNTVTDTNNVTHIISQSTLTQVKTWVIGNATYSFELMTLAELNEFVKKRGGILDTVDVSYMTSSQAEALKDYYNTHNIKPTWTNFDDSSLRTAFISSSGGDFGVYFTCDSTTDIETAISYITSNPDNKYMLNIYASSSGIGPSAVEPYIKQIRELGAEIYVYIYNNLTSNTIPAWADGIMSETINVNYEEWLNSNS